MPAAGSRGAVLSTRAGPGATQLLLLDGFGLLVDGRPLAAPSGVQRLVAYLGLHRSGARTHVAGTLWPDASEGHAQASLRTTLWRLQGVHPRLVRSDGGALALDPDVAVDVRTLVASALLVRQGEDDPECGPVLSLTGSDLLPGWYDDWVLLERERLRQLRLHALEDLSGRLMVRGRFGEAVDLALLALLAEPLRESVHRLLIQIHLAEGNRVEARRQYARYAELVRSELDESPGPAVAALLAR